MVMVAEPLTGGWPAPGIKKYPNVTVKPWKAPHFPRAQSSAAKAPCWTAPASPIGP